MCSFWPKIIGGIILLMSWLCREMWGRRQEQRELKYRKELDSKARAENSKVVVDTQILIFDSITYMQSIIGHITDDPGNNTSRDRSEYNSRASRHFRDLKELSKQYATERLSHIWTIYRDRQPTEKEMESWLSKDKSEIIDLGDEYAQKIMKKGEILEKNVKYADRIVVIFYVLGTVLLLSSE